ncbi:MAG: Gfo/Idh/MocA family protein, partial [Flavobacteriaceae bacterium]
MIKAGVLGAGHLGKIHLRLLQASKRYELIGFYDPDQKNAKALAHEKGYTAFESEAELIQACDMVDIVTPTLYHHQNALNAINQGKHIFIEKPIANSVSEARKITQMAAKKGV